ncbi:Asp23/Gls24 family envelope stress response protein [Antrihabitans cavernicola]|uniref:Asp23/Gls24 family envelope stress response protein n=1 Tax=Antrihabitans cavernicola TaxID=2495913 RepID=A0A5A7S6A1_9NOCA|nr:Asp23/Gls24 family envelope stress response protein [Spelaeibacter cavernicola]KAA0018950.1 Asp23/Gls24 family envelope stress response protein [Spelaeibacter cavernicola]
MTDAPKPDTSVAKTPGDSTDLANSQGHTVIADTVVAKIAGIATREIDGVRDLGGGAARVVGRLRESLPGASTNVSQGVSVEVGEKQAAIDVGIVAYYGTAIHELAAAIRRNVINAVERMTGLDVIEVNVTVHDVYLEGDDDSSGDSEQEPAKPPRVQ